MTTSTPREDSAAAAEPAAAPAGPARRVRIHVGELISAGSALALLVMLFAVKWYGVAGVPDPSYARPAVSTAEDGWNGLTMTRWLLLATIVVAVGAVFLHASQRRHGAKTETGRLVALLGTASSALLVYRVLIALPAPAKVIDQKLGAILGMLCAFGIAWGGSETVREQREAAARGDANHHRRPLTRGQT